MGLCPWQKERSLPAAGPTRTGTNFASYLWVGLWAKRPPLKLEVPGLDPRGWFNDRAGNRDPFRWLETARGL